MYSGDKNIMKCVDNNSATNEETILKAINIIEEKRILWINEKLNLIHGGKPNVLKITKSP